MWKVYFSGGFGNRHGRERAGEEIPLNKQFAWGNEHWHIPAMYICGKGVVVDFCMKVPAERIRSFLDKWNLSIENDGSDFSEEQQMQAGAEHPLGVNINPELVLNGKVIRHSSGWGTIWNPCIPEVNEAVAESFLQHYGLDPSSGWRIWRSAFPWQTKRKPQIRTLAATLVSEPIAVPGPCFQVTTSGEKIEFVHPVTGAAHTLTVQNYEQSQFPKDLLDDEHYEFPKHMTVMGYTLWPGLPDEAFNVMDCASSDKPRFKPSPAGQEGRTRAMGIPAVSIGIIGGADGPTAISIPGEDDPASVGYWNQGKYRNACSALHFEPAGQVEWRMVFYEKKQEDITVELG